MDQPFNKDKDVIGVFAPSSYVNREDIEKSTQRLEALGYKVFIHPQTFAKHHQFSGTIEERVSALYDLWDQKDITCIWTAGGGNGATWMLDDIDFKRLAQTPKTLIGYSDITALLNALYAHCRMPSIHGQVFKHLHEIGDTQLSYILDMLDGQKNLMPLANAKILKEGKATGMVIGGNLSLFQTLIHTLPGKFWKDNILCLEDIGGELSHLDRDLLFLRRSGVFDQINGLVFGSFSNLSDTGRPYEQDFEMIVQNHVKNLNIPVIINAPFGHEDQNFSFWMGKNSTLSASDNIVFSS